MIPYEIDVKKELNASKKAACSEWLLNLETPSWSLSDFFVKLDALEQLYFDSCCSHMDNNARAIIARKKKNAT